jgi:hypothetical protein
MVSSCSFRISVCNNIYFCQLLNIYGINDVRQTDVYTPEPLVLECSSSEVEIATEKLIDINHKVLIKFWQNWSKQEVYYILKPINLLILFGIKKQ